jgi:hypothetical protein
MSRIPRSGPIAASVVTVAELLSGAFRFRLPWFQRAYAWRVDNVGLLLTNLREAMRLPTGKRRYMLGTILLASSRDGAADALVDGHQRIMTLTIIFAVLRDLMRDEAWKQRLHGYIAGQVGGAGERNVPHLLIDADLAAFVATHVQQPGGTSVDSEDDLLSLSETERNIIENRDFLRAELGAADVSDRDRQELAAFLADHCRIIVHELEDEEEAWQSMQIEEDTRLDFSAADRSRASILSAMPAADRDAASRSWDDCQALLGAQDMRGLLGHIRNIALPHRSAAPVESEIIRHFKLNSRGLDFMRSEIEPMARRLARIKAREVGSGPESVAISRALEHLSWLDRPLWVAPALHWMNVRGEAGGDTAVFFALLERLGWILRIGGTDPSVQQTRMSKLIRQISGSVAPTEIEALQIEPRLLTAAVSNLRSKNFQAKHYAASVLRRICVALGADPGPVDGQNVTVEHILPRKPPSGTQWNRDFGRRKPVEAYVNRLGNLAFLTEPLNQLAAANDFAVKRTVFEQSVDKLIEHALSYEVWTPETIENRTRDLIRILLNEWELKP